MFEDLGKPDIQFTEKDQYGITVTKIYEHFADSDFLDTHEKGDYNLRVRQFTPYKKTKIEDFC